MQFLYLFYLFTVLLVFFFTFTSVFVFLFLFFGIYVYLIVDEKGDKTDIQILEILVIAHK